MTAHKDLCLCFTPAHSGRCGISPLMTGWGGNTRSSIYKQAEHADIRMQVEIEHVHATQTNNKLSDLTSKTIS